MRGGSAKYGDVDAVWHLRALTDNTLILKCTHRRMRVAEDYMTLTRLENPLRHEVAGNASGAAWEAQIDAMVINLDRLGLDSEAGRVTCREALKAAGQRCSNDILEAAIRERKQGLTAFTLEDE